MSVPELLHGRYVHNRRISVLSEWCSNLMPRNGSVLDVGSGDGRLARLVANKRPDISIQGIDDRLRTRRCGSWTGWETRVTMLPCLTITGRQRSGTAYSTSWGLPQVLGNRT